MHIWAIAFDLLLALGATLRLTRFIVADDVPGTWFIKVPLHHRSTTRYLEGLGCPFCVSVWMAAAVTITLLLAGGPGHAADWWRYPAGFLTLAWTAGHIAAWSGDTEE